MIQARIKLDFLSCRRQVDGELLISTFIPMISIHCTSSANSAVISSNINRLNRVWCWPFLHRFQHTNRPPFFGWSLTHWILPLAQELSGFRNTIIYTVQVTRDWFTEHAVPVVDWPASSSAGLQGCLVAPQTKKYIKKGLRVVS